MPMNCNNDWATALHQVRPSTIWNQSEPRTLKQNVINQEYDAPSNTVLLPLSHQVQPTNSSRKWQQKQSQTDWLHVHDKLRIDIREAAKDVLVEIHQEQLVGRRLFKTLTRKLVVKVADVFWTFLSTQTTSMQVGCYCLWLPSPISIKCIIIIYAFGNAL